MEVNLGLNVSSLSLIFGSAVHIVRSVMQHLAFSIFTVVRGMVRFEPMLGDILLYQLLFLYSWGWNLSCQNQSMILF